jgi:predicted DNA-binding ribbon-helix-helix protein
MVLGNQQRTPSHPMKSQVVKRSVVIDGRKTSISVEDRFWEALTEIARERGTGLSGLVSSIKAARENNSNLSSAIRVFILWHLTSRLRLFKKHGSCP